MIINCFGYSFSWYIHYRTWICKPTPCVYARVNQLSKNIFEAFLFKCEGISESTFIKQDSIHISILIKDSLYPYQELKKKHDIP